VLGSVQSGRGSRRRGYEFAVHPTQIKQLRTGQAVVLAPGSGKPIVARMHHPNENAPATRLPAGTLRGLLRRR
jgi:hypothetical protein